MARERGEPVLAGKRRVADQARRITKWTAVELTGFLMVAIPADASLKLYAESDYRALIGTFSNSMSSPRNMSSNANDTLSSFNNDTGYTVAFWHDANAKGRCFSGAPRTKAAWFAIWDDNKVSSFQLGRGC